LKEAIFLEMEGSFVSLYVSLVVQLARQSIKEASRRKSLEALAKEQLRLAAKWPTQTNKQTVGQTDRPRGKRMNPSFVIVVIFLGSPNPARLVSAPLCSLGERPGPQGGGWRSLAAAALS